MNTVNYLNHSVYKPDTYFRRFDIDVGWCQDKAKRIATASLPFIALYGPASTTLSLFSNSSRVVTHLCSTLDAEGQKNWKQLALEVGKLALAVLALSASFFHSTTGLFITTGSDILQGAYTACQSLIQAEYSKAAEEAMQTLTSAAYLGFMIGGSLEAMVLFALLQTVTSLGQAANEIKAGHFIEAAAKISMAGLRLRSANQYITAIQRRNAFLKTERAAALFVKIAKSRQATHLIAHPLTSLKERIEENNLVFTDEKGTEMNLGSHFHGNGKALVKGENIAFRTRLINGKEVIELDFKINHAFRDQLEKSITQLQKVSPKEMKEILALTGSHASSISVQSASFFKGNPNSFFSVGAAHQINVGGLGTILVGAASNQPNLYDKVVIQMDAGQNLYSLHELLCLIDLSDALCLSTKDDLERLKIGHLFHTFFPKEALTFERSADFFSLPLDALKEKMIELAPEMGEVYTTYFHKMKPESIIGGRIRYRIEGLAQAAYNEGARALTAAITGAYRDEDLFERTASMIRTGMLSHEVRDTSEIDKDGLAGGLMYLTGGADSVYTQLLTENTCKENLPFNHLYYQSKVRFLISLDALEMGSYQYHTDNWGSRLTQSEDWFRLEEFYAERSNILDFVRQEQLSFQRGNEVMLKERLSSTFFKGIIVSDVETKTKLIDYLQNCNLIQDNTILNIPVDQFFRVGTHLTEDLIA